MQLEEIYKEHAIKSGTQYRREDLTNQRYIIKIHKKSGQNLKQYIIIHLKIPLKI